MKTIPPPHLETQSPDRARGEARITRTILPRLAWALLGVLTIWSLDDLKGKGGESPLEHGAVIVSAVAISYLLGRRSGRPTTAVGRTGVSTECKQRALQRSFDTSTVRDVVDEGYPLVVGVSKTFPELISLLGQVKRPTFMVVDGRRFVGAIAWSDLAKALELRERGTVTAAMLVASPARAARHFQPLFTAIETFLRTDADAIPVLDGEEFLGVMTREAVLCILREDIRQERLRLLHDTAGFAEAARLSLLLTLSHNLAKQNSGGVEQVVPPQRAVGSPLFKATLNDRRKTTVLAVRTSDGTLVAPSDPARLVAQGDVLVVIRGEES